MRYYDNTRLTAYKDCPRKYYFRHVLGWRREGLAPALSFGLAWHDAMDVVWSLINKRQDPKKVHAFAYERFCETWAAEGMPDPDYMTEDQRTWLEPRTPGIAAEMLWEYIQQRTEFIQNCEIIAIEQPFAVPLKANDKELHYIGRFDKTIRLKSDGRIYLMEHKTTASYKGRAPDYSFTNDWLDQWSPNSQIDGYLHAGHMIYGPEFKGIIIDGAMVHKKAHDNFKLIPVERALEHMEGWLFDAQEWVRRVDHDRLMLDNARLNRFEDFSRNSVLYAFPKNTNSCFGIYNQRCAYYDLCRFWENPEVHELPDKYIVEFWDPFDILDIEKLGLTNEVIPK